MIKRYNVYSDAYWEFVKNEEGRLVFYEDVKDYINDLKDKVMLCDARCSKLEEAVNNIHDMVCELGHTDGCPCLYCDIEKVIAEALS